jgi:hypothetical protein
MYIPGLIIILILLGVIAFAWFLYSYSWDKQSEVVEFLKKNNAALIEKNIRMNLDKTIFATYISNWNECDLFLFPEGIILRGQKDSSGLYMCAFLYFDKFSHPHSKGFRYYGKYKKPKVSNNELRYYMLLYNNERYSQSRGEMYMTFTLYPDEKTIEILKQKDLL